MADPVALRNDDRVGLFAFSEDRCVTQGRAPIPLVMALPDYTLLGLTKPFRCVAGGYRDIEADDSER
ncbi:MAG: hypothetical protein Kow0026_25630 [Oricola sp.]